MFIILTKYVQTSNLEQNDPANVYFLDCDRAPELASMLTWLP